MAAAPAQGGAGDGPAPLKGPALALVAFALALGTFMQVLDSTIANVSLDRFARKSSGTVNFLIQLGVGYSSGVMYHGRNRGKSRALPCQ